MKNKWQRFWIIPPLVLAVGLVLVVPKLKKPPTVVTPTESATKVRVIEVQRMALIPKASGYGIVTPARSWDAVAEVAGQVVWLSDQLKSGNLIREGSELLHIDPSFYQLELQQIEREDNALRVKQKTQQDSLILEQRSLDSLRSDRDRKLALHKQGAVSTSDLEDTERAVIRGETAVQNLKNNLALTKADLEVLQTRIANAELQLSRTIIKAPFDVRITDLEVGVAQYANKGQLLFRADSIDQAEVEARFPIGRLRPLISSRNSTENVSSSPSERSPGALKLAAKVKLSTANHTVEWPAQVTRVAGQVDPKTQTIGVVVVIDQPYSQAQPGKRPPLVRNTFVEVELSKQSKGKPLVIPASSLREGKVYVANPENRLESRKVKVMVNQDGAIGLNKGVDEGERVLVRPPVPAVEGMLLDPVLDDKAVKHLEKALGLSIEKSGKKDKAS